MEIRKFRIHYGLELITASHSGISLGDLVWDPLAAAPHFSHPGMPNTIFSAFLDAALIDEQEFLAFKNDCSNIEAVAAHFADKKVDVDTEFIAGLQHPSLGTIDGNFKLDTISKFRFGDLKVKEMSDLLRVKIDQYLEKMKSKKWEEYDGRISRVNMITELYYGSIKLEVERSISGNLDSALRKSDLAVHSKTESSKSVEYSFSNDNVPFAMRIEKVRNFNG